MITFCLFSGVRLALGFYLPIYSLSEWILPLLCQSSFVSMYCHVVIIALPPVDLVDGYSWGCEEPGLLQAIGDSEFKLCIYSWVCEGPDLLQAISGSECTLWSMSMRTIWPITGHPWQPVYTAHIFMSVWRAWPVTGHRWEQVYTQMINYWHLSSSVAFCLWQLWPAFIHFALGYLYYL